MTKARQITENVLKYQLYESLNISVMQITDGLSDVCHDEMFLAVLSEYMPQTSAEDLCRRSTRVVIQCIYRQLGVLVCYRVVVYQDGSVFQPLEFSSLDSLIAAFRTIDPEFDGHTICQDNSGQTHIVFAKDMLLSRKQLAGLGMKQANSGL